VRGCWHSTVHFPVLGEAPPPADADDDTLAAAAGADVIVRAPELVAWCAGCRASPICRSGWGFPIYACSCGVCVGGRD
jgi:hypothetical protein